MIAKAFHTIVLLYYVYVFIGLLNISNLRTTDKKAIQVTSLAYRYLTNWNVGIQILHFILSLTNDVIEKVGQRKLQFTLKKFIDYWFFTITFPNALYVAVSFWTLHLYNSKTIFAVPVNMIMPDWLNHSIHTIIVPLVYIEAILVYRQLPPWKPTFKIYLSFVTLYGVCLLETYIEKGVWVYPLFEHMTHFQRLLTCLAFIISGIVCFFISRISKIIVDRVVFKDEAHISREKIR